MLKRNLVSTSSASSDSSDSESSSDVNSLDQPKSPTRSSTVKIGKQALNNGQGYAM